MTKKTVDQIRDLQGRFSEIRHTLAWMRWGGDRLSDRLSSLDEVSPDRRIESLQAVSTRCAEGGLVLTTPSPRRSDGTPRLTLTRIPELQSRLWVNPGTDISQVQSTLAGAFYEIVNGSSPVLRSVPLLPTVPAVTRPSVLDWIDGCWRSKLAHTSRGQADPELAAACCFLIHRIGAATRSAGFRAHWWLLIARANENADGSVLEDFDFDPLDMAADPAPNELTDLESSLGLFWCVSESRLTVGLLEALELTVEYLTSSHGNAGDEPPVTHGASAGVRPRHGDAHASSTSASDRTPSTAAPVHEAWRDQFEQLRGYHQTAVLRAGWLIGKKPHLATASVEDLSADLTRDDGRCPFKPKKAVSADSCARYLRHVENVVMLDRSHWVTLARERTPAR